MKKFLILALSVSAPLSAVAQVNIASGYSENFDSVIAGTATFSSTIGVQAAIPGLGTWQGTKRAGTGTTATNYRLEDGSGNAGALYGFRNTGTAEYALGGLASGTNAMAWGVQLVNNGNQAITSVTISFTQENWRSSTTTQNVINAQYARSSDSAATAANYLTSASNFIDVDLLDLVGPAPLVTNGAVDGNLPANQTFRTATITFASAPLLAGESLWLRWQDVDDAGADAGLAIDNLNVTVQSVPEPATIAALGVGAIALIRRRRSSR